RPSRAVLLYSKSETQIFRRVQSEIHRTEFADRRPIMINRETGQAARIRLIVIPVPVVVALAVIDSQVVQALFGNRDLPAWKWISTKTAGVNGIGIRVIVCALRRSPEQVEILDAKPVSEVEKLQVLLAPPTGIHKPVSARD